MLFMGDYEGPAAFKALLKSDDKKNTKFKADVWALPHHGAALKLQGLLSYIILIMYVILT